MKDSKYMNPDGTFKGGFTGCVSHMMEVEGHSRESATKICGYIAQHVKNRRAASPSPGGDSGSVQRRGEAGTHLQLAPLLNRSADGKFALPGDGWFQLAPKGEYPHSESGQLQVLDEPAINAIVKRFESESRAANFAGLLIDYDHFSYDTDKPSEAAGWITALQHRAEAQSPGRAGLWAQVKWTPEGEAAIKNGNYRFISPVWLPAQVEKLASNKIRPLRLDTAGLTNSPNLKGMVPLSNRRSAGAPAVSPGASPGPLEGGRTDRAPLAAAQTPPSQTQSKMKNVCLALGLSADASEEAALAEVAQLKNRLDSAEKNAEPLNNRVSELEKQNSELLAAQAEADLDKYQNRFDPKAREKWRAQLLANRAATIDLLDSLSQSAGGRPPGGRPHSGSPQDLTIPIHNRAAAATPGDRAAGGANGGPPDEDAKAHAAAKARRVANRARELSKTLGYSHAKAWQMAQSEEVPAPNTTEVAA